jgi:hypothetical protein
MVRLIDVYSGFSAYPIRALWMAGGRVGRAEPPVSRQGSKSGFADRGNRAGALVIVHEAVGLASELGPGWLERPATPLRTRGSSFWAGGVEREWVTSNRRPVWWPAQQQGLFAPREDA